MTCARGGWLVTVVVLTSALSASAQPATKPAPPAAVDYVADLFDLYYQGRERDRFFAAAGVDGEMTKEEFAAAGQAASFVRAYDRWAVAAVFDADHNGRLDWVEAEQYRLGLRARLLRMFDRNGDGRLTGPERDAANAYLAAGMGRPRLGTLSRPAPPRPAKRPGAGDLAALAGPGSHPDASSHQRWQRVMARYDADKDGQLSVQERFVLHEHVRQEYRRRLLARFDANHNGMLDGQELAAAENQQRRQAEEMRRQFELLQWDANRDGRLDPSEQATMRTRLEQHRRRTEQRRREWIRRWDTNGDGKLSKDEHAAITADTRRRAALQRQDMDANGDGQLTAEEIRAYRKKLFDARRRRGQEP